MINDTTERLMHTLRACVSPYHAVQEAERQLAEAGFEELSLTKRWTLEEGNGYYVPVFDSSLVAFTIGMDLEHPSLRMEAAHTDWPCLKLKPNPEVKFQKYGKLNVEVYGGPILSTWLDRPLGLAGKVCVRGENAFAPDVRFIDVDRAVATVPNLAIHMNREINNGYAFNAQVDMLPLAEMLRDTLENDNFLINFLADELNVDAGDILDYELYLYNLDQPMCTGLKEELLSSPRIDNITSVQACLTGIIESYENLRDNSVNVITLYDNEEVGSRTKQGAQSSITDRILEKLFTALGYGRSEYLDIMMDGFLVSMDVAHAIHPNHPEKCDIKNQICLNDGLAIKMAASQSYATDASCVSVIEALCRDNDIRYRKFSNNSSIRGGSTLGALSSALLSMRTVDIGVPILAMHSARELMGVDDQEALELLAEKFFTA
jgi:aspartyl aminopeptidase